MNSLKGIKILELAGLAPAPFCGKILKDFGATIIRIEKLNSPDIDVFKDDKLTLYIDLKKDEGQSFVKDLCKQVDVLIDPFRAGVLEKINLNPNELLKINNKLIVARLTGYGQNGPLAQRAGHDINYLSLSGLMSQFTSENSNKPVFPVNILGDFAAGSLMCAFGICLSLFEREKTGKGKIIDSNITENSSYIGSWIFKTRKPETIMQGLVWPNLNEKHSNLLDGGQAFYSCYETKDKKYMALGAIEAQFFEEFISNLKKSLNPEESKKFDLNEINQFDENLKIKLKEIFLLKTRDEWTNIFLNTDSCCTPVLEPEEVYNFEHFRIRETFENEHEPKPSLKFLNDQIDIKKNENLIETLNSLNISNEKLNNLIKNKVVKIDKSKL